MMRLLKHAGPKPGTMEFLKECQHYAEKHGITLVLKGGPTYVFHPEEKIMVNPYGDPGMATAGSGDVLTGIIAALLAQGVTPKNAAPLGVYLHAYAGEDAAELKTSYCLMARDIIDHLPSAFWSLK
jgi:NAD(P)H-hydrate epimerase